VTLLLSAPVAVPAKKTIANNVKTTSLILFELIILSAPKILVVYFLASFFRFELCLVLKINKSLEKARNMLAKNLFTKNRIFCPCF
jgi:hypothetical protein